MNNLAIIPARSGSTGLPNKNIRPLCGKPLIAYTIDAAINSDIFCEVMVSTDSIQYRNIAVQQGASVPFLRSKQAAADEASSWDTVAEVLTSYRKMGKIFDTFCLLQPTSPLRTAGDIQNAYKTLETLRAKSVASVCEADHSPLACNTLPENSSMAHFLRKGGMRRRQDQPTYYRINGAIYICETAHFAQNTFSYDESCYAYIMDKSHSIDIDDELDFRIAETLLKSPMV